jgi:hypothetical protein
MRPILELDVVTPETFSSGILAAGEPAVFRGFVGDWPAVAAAHESDEAFCRYVRRFDRGYEVDAMYGPPSIGGRLFYNEDLSGLNCRKELSRLSTSLDYLLEHRGDDPAPALAIQSVLAGRYLPGFEAENVLPAGFVPEDCEPRLWLGSRVTVAAHFDPSENIACCIAGRRRFTLFPPAQVRNLYVGPFELTPSGATISMVDFDAPDFERFPRFAEALDAGVEAVLEPGDAVYVPYLWWHHVRSLDAVNGLVNYWWSRVPERCGDPRNALLHAILALRDLPPPHRDAWQGLFEHYVFEDAAQAAEHLPANRRGLLGAPTAEDVGRLRKALSRALGRG